MSEGQPKTMECPECDGTGNWTGWSGDDEHTQEGGCDVCDGTGRVAAPVSEGKS